MIPSSTTSCAREEHSKSSRIEVLLSPHTNVTSVMIFFFLYLMGKRRTLDIDKDLRCYRCPHINITSVTVIGSVNNVIVFQLVCESRMGIFV